MFHREAVDTNIMGGIRKLRMLLCVTLIAILTGGAKQVPSSWTDPRTGIALGGYDPMSYVTNSEPVQGHPSYEHFWGGVTWRFYNEGNQAAFARHPQVYAPLYAGYDPVILAKGKLVEGKPVTWEIHMGRLYLFYSTASLKTWRKHRDKILAKAKSIWPKLSLTIDGPYDTGPDAAYFSPGH